MPYGCFLCRHKPIAVITFDIQVTCILSIIRQIIVEDQLRLLWSCLQYRHIFESTTNICNCIIKACLHFHKHDTSNVAWIFGSQIQISILFHWTQVMVMFIVVHIFHQVVSFILFHQCKIQKLTCKLFFSWWGWFLSP